MSGSYTDADGLKHLYLSLTQKIDAKVKALKSSLENLQTGLSKKADAAHTHDKVNGLKIVTSNTAPTVDDKTVITIVVGDGS